MASDILHIKDSYYFEVPKFLWGSSRESIDDFPDVWVRLDPDFQKWEAERLAAELAAMAEGAPSADDLVHQWEHWQHEDHANHGRPLDVYLEMQHGTLQDEFHEWRSADQPARGDKQFADFLNETDAQTAWFALPYATDEQFQQQWREAKAAAGGPEAVARYTANHTWDQAKLDSYNQALRGKILIPQPFGQLRNLYERESGFCISKFMVIEVVVALIVLWMFSWLARRMQEQDRPRGRRWNFLEAMLLFVRDQIARPAIGHGADKFVPLLWTMFVFVLLCNLFGLLPWLGAPTGAFGVTTAMAAVTLGTGVVFGMQKFGPLGFFLNQIPSMDLPFPMGYIIKPLVFGIEMLGLMIKHGVLAVRLLANMVAGHLVLLGVMGLAFGAHAAHQYQGEAASWWGVTAVIAIVGSTLFSCLELFVACLQAYIFTFLSALFIGAAVHHH